MASPEPIRPSAVPATAGVAGFALMWVVAAVAASIPLVALSDVDESTPIGVLAASLVCGWIVFVVGTVSTSRRHGTGDVRSDFGLTARPIDVLGLPIGVAGQVLLIPVLYLPLEAIWPATFNEETLSETAEDLVDRADGALLALLFVLVVVGAPLVEEIVYRGLLQRPLLGRFSTPLVLVGVAAVFAVIHFRPIEYPGLFAAGLVFGVCAWRTRRVGMAVAAHVGFNATGLVLAL